MAGRQDGGLSSEQIRRMEENRRQAQQRLSNKRTAAASTSKGGLSASSTSHTSSSTPPQFITVPQHTQCGPPPAKRPALNSDPSYHYQPVQRKIGPPPNSLSDHCHSYSYGQTSSTGHSVTLQRRPVDSAVVSTLTLDKHPPQMTGGSSLMPSSSGGRVGTFGDGIGWRGTGSAAGTRESISSATPSSSLQKKFTAIQQRIKANLVLVSRARFKVLVPYNANVIDIFKKMPSKSYDAKNATWSFGVEDYNTLVDALKKDCKYVDLSLIPRPVISLFQRLKQRKGPIPDPHSAGMDWSRIEAKLSSTLMQFQRDGVEFSVVRDGRVLIADDMGLGKTLQAIAVMSHYRSDWPLLVVCPSSVRLTWAEAFKRWLPSLSEEDVNVVLSTKISATSGLINIISYDLMSKMAKELQEKKFMAVIADESHFLKNYKTARCKAAMPILKAAKRAILLSGTPALSRPIELYTQITVIDKNFRSVSLYEFGQRYCNGVKGHFGWDFSGASNMHELQLYMEEAIMIRRFKGDVLDQLPTKRRQMVLLDPTLTKNKDKSDWKAMKEELTKAGKLKALDRKNALLPLFEKTGRIKTPAIRDYILDLMEGGRKLIVFAHHKVVLDAISEAIDGKGYGYVRIDGRTPAELRQSFCDQFQHDEKCLLAILSITTANAGLTLTASSTVVFAELFWNPGILVQAEDRAYRIGQKNSVNIHYLVARDTADDFIWPLIQGKLDVLSQAGLSKDDFSKADSTFMKDPSQLSLFECFNELISDKELVDMASFNQEDTPSIPSGSSSSNDHNRDRGSSAEMSKAYTTKDVASALTMDDDPDFTTTYRVSGPVQGMSEQSMRSIQCGTKAKTSQSSGKVTSTKSGRKDGHTANLQKQSVKYKTLANASRLANYLLQHIDIAPAECESVLNKDQVTHETTCEDEDTIDTIEESGGECKGENIDSLELFGLNSEEDLEDFEHFEDSDLK